MLNHLSVSISGFFFGKKRSLSNPLSIVIIFAILCIIIVIIIAFFGFKNFNSLNDSIGKIDSATKNKELYEDINNELLLAENEYRIFLYSHDDSSRRAFSFDIKGLSQKLEKLKTIADTSLVSSALNDINKKMSLEQELDYLQQLSDSLLENASHKVIIQNISPTVKIKKMNEDILRNFYLSGIDTVEVKQEVKKQSFFQKLRSAFSNKQAKDSFKLAYAKGDQKTSNKSDTSRTYRDSLIDQLSKNINDYYQQSVDRALSYKAIIAEREKRLGQININLLNTIAAIFKGIEDQNLSALQRTIRANKNNIAVSQRNLTGVSIYTLLLIVFLSILLFNSLSKTIDYEKDIISARKRAENLSSMKGRFLSNMSHEIRSPLTSIIGFAEQLDNTNKNVDDQRSIHAIQSASDHLLKVVNDILDFSKLEAGKLTINPEIFSPQQAIEEVIYGMNIIAVKKNLKLILTSAIDKKATVWGDKLRLMQILYNLIGNAIKFTSHGSVMVIASLKEVEEKMVLDVDVNDTGIGIPATQIDSIFEEFSQLDIDNSINETPVNRGTGLGLSISKMLIDLQHGSISLKSVLKQGSSFHFSLPYQASSQAIFFKNKIDQNEGFVKKEDRIHFGKILIAEDNELNILLLTTILNINKTSYDIVTNGEDALRKFNDENYDLVLTDIFLPGLSGIELTKNIRKSTDAYKASKPILAFTSNVLKEDIDLYFRVGFTDYISKPTTQKDLLDTLKKYA